MSEKTFILRKKSVKHKMEKKYIFQTFQPSLTFIDILYDGKSRFDIKCH